MAAVISARTVERAARHGAFKAGKSLHDTGQVAGLQAADFGARGRVADTGTAHDVRVGIRYQFLVGECDCADAAPETTSDDYLQAAASGEQDRPELCAHAVAVALAAIDARLPWASAPAGHRPRHQRVIERITTLAPPFDITTVFPELSTLAAATVRLHPRAGRPDIRGSSLGGPLLWPADQPWPVCTRPHVNWERVPVPADITSWEEAEVWAATLGSLARLNTSAFRLDGAPVEAVIDRSEHRPCPLVGVLQIHARNVPDLPFPDGTDLFQLLWCPNNHGEPWYGPRPAAFWRRAADVTEVLQRPPEPEFDTHLNATRYDPVPCLLHPERVTEYPDYDDLPDRLRQRVEEWDKVWEDDAPHLYWSSLSTAPGTKALGHPRWIQAPQWPACARCGQRMTHLVTISSEEFGGDGRWRPDDEPPSSFPRNFAPHGILIGDVGDMYLFTCTACPHRPLDGSSQFT